MNYEENRKAFDDFHPIASGVKSGGVMLFEDGAYRELSSGVCRPAPTDPYLRATKIVVYWKTKLTLKVQEFSYRKQQLLSRTTAGLGMRQCPPAPPVEALQKLKELKAGVEACAAKLQAAEENVIANKPEDMIRQENFNAENRKNCSAFLSAVKAIEV